MSLLLIAGKKSSKYREEVNRLYQQFEKFHFDPEKKDLFKFLPDSSLQGEALIRADVQRKLHVNAEIAKFVALLVNRPIPWTRWKNPLE